MSRARKTLGLALTFALGLTALIAGPRTTVAAPPQSVSPFAGDYCGWINDRPALLSISESGQVSGVWESGHRDPYDLNSLSGTVADDGSLDVTLTIVTVKIIPGGTKTGFPKTKRQWTRIPAMGFVELDSDGNLSGWIMLDTATGEAVLFLDLIRC